MFQPLHPSNALEALPPNAYIGRLADGVSAPLAAPMGGNKVPSGERPQVGAVLNLDEFEVGSLGVIMESAFILTCLALQLIAQEHLSDQAWAYYASAGDDEISELRARSSEPTDD